MLYIIILKVIDWMGMSFCHPFLLQTPLLLNNVVIKNVSFSIQTNKNLNLTASRGCEYTLLLFT